tara:strand:+ start:77 stop:532 length:456 start_codon:yes stop_codon:yes gene_type:complete
MKKIVLNIFLFFILSNCGFAPIYSKSYNQNFDIELESILGDRLINNLIVSELNRNKNDQSEKKIFVDINTDYKKTIYSKNATGATASYELNVISEINIKYKNKIENINITEKFIMDKNDDSFSQNNYEQTIKRSFASSITQKILFKLNSIK